MADMRIALAALILAAHPAFAQTGIRPAEAVDPFDAIAGALAAYRVIGLGEGAHRGEQDHAFRMALIRHARVMEGAQDIVTECGNSRYQDVMDRYIRGEEVPPAALRRTWEDSIVATTVCDSSVYRDFYAAVRQVNAGRPRDRQWRVLLGGPPIDWNAVKSFDDITKFESGRDRFAADLIRREVLAKGRRALVMYGRIHMLLRHERDNFESASSLAAQLEADGIPVFKIWTAVGGSDPGSIQASVRSWHVPALARIRGTQLGAADFQSYFPSDGRLALRDGQVLRIPREQWRPMPMENLVDAVLYLGQTLTYARIPVELCSDAAYMDMRVARLSLVPGGEGEIDRLKQKLRGASMIRGPLLLLILLALAVDAAAHHGSAEYDVGREIRVTGTVQEWRWTNPHTWVYLTASNARGDVQRWSGEGPPLTWAEQRGWSRTTLRAGEEVTLVMYPSRRDPNAGLVKQIRRANGELLVISRPWLGERN